MEHSKYISYHKSRRLRKPKARVVAGSFEDRNKYYRCVRCGFIFDIEQTQVGGEAKGSYIDAPDPPVYDEIRNTGDSASYLSIWDPFQIGGLVTRNDAGEVIQIPPETYYHRVSQGCPLCGCVAQF